MLKKLIAVILCASLCFSLSGCLLLLADSSESSSEQSIPNDTRNESSAGFYESTNEEPEQTESAEQANIEETVIFDKEGIKITAVSLEDDYPNGQKLKIYAENNTEKNITFSGNYFDVNGYTLSSLCYIDVAAGKKTNDYIEFFNMEDAGIENIAYIKNYDGKIFDSDTFDNLYEVTFEISTASADTYTVSYNPEGQEIVKTEDFEVYVSRHHDSIFGTYIDLFIINNTDKGICVKSDNLSVNGFTIDELMYETVCKNTAAYGNIILSETDMETNGISEIEEITLTLEFLSEDTFDTLYMTDEICVNFIE